MNKFIFVGLSFLFFSCAHVNSDLAHRQIAAELGPYALMSPQQGDLAFSTLYGFIANAKTYAYITIYSWSDSGLEAAIQKAIAANPKIKIRAVLDPGLKNSAKVLNVVPNLEELGVEFKIAPMNMHEKFTIIDDSIVINTSANFSNGAKTKYSENMVFHELSNDSTTNTNLLINDFKNEFVILWNTAKDITTNAEKNSEMMNDVFKSSNIPTKDTDMTLYSSSMNWTLKSNLVTSAQFKQGRYQSLVAKKYENLDEQMWTVRDVLIEKINAATKNIYLSLNHFNIRAVSDALIAAVKRGVEVRFTVDAQEYKSRPNDLEMSPQFVADWSKIKGNNSLIPPVRVKYYSHEPNPSTWLLNHHKFVLIDYGIANKTLLLSGSYNLSKNAEQNQFDNLILYKTDKYLTLYKSFYNEFEYLWDLNRVDNKPKQSILDLFLTAKEGIYPIHINEAVSMTFPEIADLRTAVGIKAPGIFTGLTKNNACKGYNPGTKLYTGCPAVKQ